MSTDDPGASAPHEPRPYSKLTRKDYEAIFAAWKDSNKRAADLLTLAEQFDISNATLQRLIGKGLPKFREPSFLAKQELLLQEEQETRARQRGFEALEDEQNLRNSQKFHLRLSANQKVNIATLSNRYKEAMASCAMGRAIVIKEVVLDAEGKAHASEKVVQLPPTAKEIVTGTRDLVMAQINLQRIDIIATNAERAERAQADDNPLQSAAEPTPEQLDYIIEKGRFPPGFAPELLRRN